MSEKRPGDSPGRSRFHAPGRSPGDLAGLRSRSHVRLRSTNRPVPVCGDTRSRRPIQAAPSFRCTAEVCRVDPGVSDRAHRLGLVHSEATSATRPRVRAVQVRAGRPGSAARLTQTHEPRPSCPGVLEGLCPGVCAVPSPCSSFPRSRSRRRRTEKSAGRFSTPSRAKRSPTRRSPSSGAFRPRRVTHAASFVSSSPWRP